MLMLLDEFDVENFEVDLKDEPVEDHSEVEHSGSDEEPKSKRQKKAFNPSALANAFQSVLRQNLGNVNTDVSGSDSENLSKMSDKASHNESVPILAKSGAITDFEESQIDYRARKILKAQIRATQESVHFSDANAPETLNFERSLRKLATRGVVQLFNAIQTAQQKKDEEKQKRRMEKLAEAQKNLPLAGNESFSPISDSPATSSSASYFEFLKQQQKLKQQSQT